MVSCVCHSHRWRIALALIAVFGLAVPLAGMLVHHAGPRDRICAASMDGVFMALLNYEAVNGHLPATICCDNRGRPLFSWRFALIPFLESACGDARFDMAWDDPANIPWSQTAHSYLLLIARVTSNSL